VAMADLIYSLYLPNSVAVLQLRAYDNCYVIKRVFGLIKCVYFKVPS
jgi:hypothetical protein